ncbi:MAG TPA: PEGA domain-containing protein [Terriglobia bacterium]|nr:PEGA domain-containing protein [Terriglobia bacterium]
MKRFWKSAAIAFFAIVMMAPVASARGRSGVVVVPYYGFTYGPAYYPWWGPWGYYPYGPGYYYRGPVEGRVKIETKLKGDSIYVDGGYAGVTGKLKKFSLKPGTHTIELRDQKGHQYYSERINVIAGRTLKIRPDYPG